MRRFIAFPFFCVAVAFFWIWCKVAGAQGFIGEFGEDRDEDI